MYEESGSALVRAYGNEPRIMEFFIDDSGLIMVRRPGSTVAIPYPREFLYEADLKLAGLLSKAFVEDKKAELESLWGAAKPMPLEECLV